MAQSKILHKLYKYVKGDDLTRVKSCVRKHCLDLKTLRLRDRRRSTALHVACRFGGRHVFDHILLLLGGAGAGDTVAMVPDTRGNVPLYVAMKAALRQPRRDLYRTMVLPLLTACPASLTVRNARGKSPRDLLEALDRADRVRSAEPPSQPIVISDDEEDEAKVDDSWEEKLRNEMDDEYQSQWGRYEDDFTFDASDGTGTAFDEDGRETYDAWAERLCRERRSKNSRPDSTGSRKPTKEARTEPSEWTDNDQRNFERKCAEEQERRTRAKERQSLEGAKDNYARCCSKLFKSDEPIRLSDVPCQATTQRLVTILDFGLETLPSLAARKRYMREQQVMWHPDKFSQKCGARIRTDDLQSVLDRVKNISQTINAYLAKYGT